jgi:hypothetical protein
VIARSKYFIGVSSCGGRDVNKIRSVFSGYRTRGPPRENGIVLSERGSPWPDETARGQERAEASDAFRGVTT